MTTGGGWIGGGGIGWRRPDEEDDEEPPPTWDCYSEADCSSATIELMKSRMKWVPCEDPPVPKIGLGPTPDPPPISDVICCDVFMKTAIATGLCNFLKAAKNALGPGFEAYVHCMCNKALEVEWGCSGKLESATPLSSLSQRSFRQLQWAPNEPVPTTRVFVFTDKLAQGPAVGSYEIGKLLLNACHSGQFTNFGVANPFLDLAVIFKHDTLHDDIWRNYSATPTRTGITGRPSRALRAA